MESQLLVPQNICTKQLFLKQNIHWRNVYEALFKLEQFQLIFAFYEGKTFVWQHENGNGLYMSM